MHGLSQLTQLEQIQTDPGLNDIHGINMHMPTIQVSNFDNHKVLKKLQRLYLNDQNNSLKSRVGHNRCAFLIITHTHFPTAIDATLFSWTLQADDKLTLVNSEHSEAVGDMYIKR